MPSNSESSPVHHLIALRSHFEQQATEAEAKAATLREQIEHVNALLLHQLAPAHGIETLETFDETTAPELFLSAQADSPTDYEDLALTLNTPEAALSLTSETPEPITETAPEPTPATVGRSKPRAMQPPYQELTRLKAIAKVLQERQGQEVTINTLIQELFGTLSAAEQKKEAKRLNTLLNQGQKLKLWQKGKKPSSYLIKSSAGKRKERSSKKGSTTASNTSAAMEGTKTQPTAKATAKTRTQSNTTKAKPGAGATKPRGKAKASPEKPEIAAAKPRISLTLLPAFAGKTKQDAIVSVLEQNSGEELHHDEIIQLLYGNLSQEDLKAERKRMTTALRQGVSTNKWQKASAPASYQLASVPKNAQSKSTGRKSKATKAKPGGAAAKPRVLPALRPAYAGMTKQEAITAVLEQHRGEVLHQDTIILSLFGNLSYKDLRAERKRMNAPLLKGVNANEWQKAPAQSSYILPSASKEAKANSTERKSIAPNPQTETVAEVTEEVVVPSATTAAKKPNKGRKTSASKAKAPTKSKAKTPRPRATPAKTKAKA